MVSIARYIEDHTVCVISVDCFDTLLLRDGLPEVEKFNILSRRLAALPICLHKGCTPSSILQSRIHATEIAYRTATLTDGGREARHDDILRLQLTWLRIEQSWRSEFRRVEIELECEMLRPNLALSSLCRTSIEMGMKLVIASDMYLDVESISYLLNMHGLGGLASRIYVSSERKTTKRGGGLFRCIADNEGKPLSTILHVGDMYQADYIVPSSLGVKACWTPRHWTWRAMHALRTLSARSRYRSLCVAS